MNINNLSQNDQDSLKELGTDALVLFGSHATNTASEASDYDFGVLLNEKGRKMRYKNYHEFYTAIYDILADKFGDLNGLDVVFLDLAPLELRRHVALHGIILLENIPGLVADFNAETTLLYADFEPFRKMMNQAVLQHI